jgi:hypothetical protein
MMTRNERRLMRLAVAIHEPLISGQTTSAHVELPTASWQQGEHLLRRMRRAQQRGWRLAVQRLQRDLREVLCRLHGELSAIDRLLEPQGDESRQATIGDIHADLVALHEEFDEVSFNRRGKTISVTTEPIELEGVYLGPFEIRLDWSNLADGHPSNYRVIALDDKSWGRPSQIASCGGVRHRSRLGLTNNSVRSLRTRGLTATATGGREPS